MSRKAGRLGQPNHGGRLLLQLPEHRGAVAEGSFELPESISTDDKDVASILAAAELTKLTGIGTTTTTADALGKAFQTIYRAIIEVRYHPGAE